jgi:hypothetical protein
MFDLNELPKIPRYEMKLPSGELKSYDPVSLSYKLRVLEGEDDPDVIGKVVCEVFEISVDGFTAAAILKDFFAFATANLEEPLKKVFGQGLSSTITTVLPPTNSGS